MEVSRFSLGVRFDFLYDSVNNERINRLFEQLCSAIPAEIAEGLLIYGGRSCRSEFDGDSVYMVVFTKGCLKNMRRLYALIDSDAVLHGMLCAREPYLQNNVLRDIEGLEYFGIVEADGFVRGGSGLKLPFAKKPLNRAKVDLNKQVLVVPNAFKGTFSSFEAASAICASLRNKMPCACITALPVADGGDGTLNAVESMLQGRKRTLDVTSPYGKKIKASYYSIDGEKAVIESALVSGLAVCADEELDPQKATSRGTGELILRALHEGLTKIFICLGGSATNDCGIGALSALGYRFLNAEGEAIDSADRLEEAVQMDASAADPLIKKAEFTVVCDVENQLLGPSGATFTFGKQKGADDASLEKLEKGMKNIACILDGYAGAQISTQKGAGAAGGMGAAFMAVLGAKYASGANTLLDIAGFDKKLEHTAVVVTGEGRIDATSVGGKAVGVIADRAAAHGIPSVLIGGSRGEGAEAAEKKALFSIYCEQDEDRKKALREAADKLADFIKNSFGL